jgi:DNA-binding transcriptional MerR regulator
MKIDYFRASHIAKRTGIAEETVRQYLEDFDDFFTFARKGVTKLYTPDSLYIITRISALYAEGNTTDEVKEILNRELPQLLEQKTMEIKDTECPDDG